MRYDVIIIGGGMAGITLGLTLSSQGVRTALIEKSNIDELYNLQSDGRASAISYQSMKIYQKYNLDSALSDISGPIEDILITDGDSKQYLFFDGSLVKENPLGYMLENINLLKALYKKSQNANNLDIYSEDFITDIHETSSCVEVTTSLNQKLSASLLISAEGKESKIRQEYLNIDTHKTIYNQSALVVNVSHEENHQNIAQEKFHKNGPFAILPLKGGYSSSIVWTEKDHIINYLKELPIEDFKDLLKEKFTDYLGDIEIITQRFSYKLYAQLAKSYFKNRVALIGDAAHFMHPIAGQGFNLAMKDIDLLTTLIIRNISLGLDIGSYTLLKEYEIARKKDNNAMFMITDSLNKLFSNNYPIISGSRKIGLSLVDSYNPIKSFFMKYAMGLRN